MPFVCPPAPSRICAWVCGSPASFRNSTMARLHSLRSVSSLLPPSDTVVSPERTGAPSPADLDLSVHGLNKPISFGTPQYDQGRNCGAYSRAPQRRINWVGLCGFAGMVGQQQVGSGSSRNVQITGVSHVSRIRLSNTNLFSNRLTIYT